MKKGYIKNIIATVVMTCSLFTFLACGNTTTAYAEQIPNESGYVFGNVNITGGGYIPDVIFNKSEKDLAYLRTDMGGAYRWDPENKKWIPITDWISAEDWNLLGCESIATDPIDTDRVYVLAGTYTNDWTDQNGYILRSTDRGENFEKIELPFKVGGNMPGRNMGERLSIDPNDNSVLYLGGRSGHGLWKSTDYGSTWNKVDSFKEIGDYKSEGMEDLMGIAWIIFDPSSSDIGQPSKTIYVGAANSGKQNTVFVSKDAGETWNPVEGQPTYDWEPTKETPGNYLPHHAVLASNEMLYISYCNQEGPYNGNKGGVWKYDTKNNTWTEISPVKGDDAYWGYGGITVDAVNPDIIMTTTLNSWYPDANIYRSIDGGKTWDSFWEYGENGQRQNNYSLDYSAAPWLDWSKSAVAPETSPKLGWMVGSVQIDPFDSNHIVYGTGATLYGSYNMTNLEQGKKFDLSVQAEGVEETAILDLVSLPEGTEAVLASGTGDIGGFIHKDIKKSPKMPINPTIGNCTSIDYAELNPNKIIRVGDHGTIGISKDGGDTWFQTTGSMDIGKATGDYLSTGGTIAMSADGNTILYSPSADNTTALYSTDDGTTWHSSNGIPAKAKICSDRVNPNKFYGIVNGEFYVSEDQGANFVKTTDGLYDGSKGAIDISAMPGVEGDIWFAGDGIWHSTDSGKTFEKLSNVDNASIIGFGKAAAGKNYMSLYTHAVVNGIDGIYRSDDIGKSWIKINDDKHKYGAANTTITGDKREYGKFYLGTNGRGIVYGELKDTK